MASKSSSVRRIGGHPWWWVVIAAGVLSPPAVLAEASGGLSQLNVRLPVVFLRDQQPARDSWVARAEGLTARFSPGEARLSTQGTEIRIAWPGSRPARPEGDGALEGRANYLLGRNPSEWQLGAALYGGVLYRDLYPGIDLRYRGDGPRLKSEYIVAPGADPSQILVEYRGARRLTVAADGGLAIKTAQGTFHEAAPRAFQRIGSREVDVPAAYRVSGGTVTFALGRWDRSTTLWIDPVLSYSSYLGGSGTERAQAVAVDSSGCAYITGYTDSANLATSSSAAQRAWGGSTDAFVVKLNAAGTGVVYWTYLGGTGDDRAYSIRVDSAGQVYLAGSTTSADFPLVAPYQNRLKGGKDGFAVKLNAAGTALVYSTYLGGSGADLAQGVALDSAGNAYVAGQTASSDFPVTSTYQTALRGPQDAFVAKFSPAGALLYGTYFGGTGDDRGTGVAVDGSGNAYLAGVTTSTNLPVRNAFQAATGGGQDVFVAKLGPTGLALLYASYLGGAGTDFLDLGTPVAVDASGQAYLAGRTTSLNLPVVSPAQSTHKGGTYDGFVAKVSASGSSLVYLTYLGGSAYDAATAVAVDTSGRAYVTGYTSSTNFPTASASTQPAFGGGYDAFLARLSANGATLMESTLLGGVDTDAGYGIAIDGAGAGYVVGQTTSANFPTQSPAQGTPGGGLDAFIAKFTFGGGPSAVSVSPASGNGLSATFALIYTDPLGGDDISTADFLVGATPAAAGSCWVRYTRASNQLQLADDAGALSAGVPLGSATTLQNHQCSVDLALAFASTSGNNLSLTVPLSFNGVYAGAKNLYMQVQTNGGDSASWQSKGVWTVPAGNQSPVSVSVTPSTGAGSSQTFSFVYSDPNGAVDLRWTEALISSTLTTIASCHLHYDRGTNTLYLTNDAGTDWVAWRALGTPGTLANSQCTIDTTASSAAADGNTLSLSVSVAFRAGFAGAKNVYMQAMDLAGVSAGWTTNGAWTVIAPNEAPSGVSVSPSSGSGAARPFTFISSDPNGFTDITRAIMIVHTQVSSVSSCFIEYTRSTNSIALSADNGGGWVGSAVLGSAVTLQNSQCSVAAQTSSAGGSGNTLTVTLALSFAVSFAGNKNTYLAVVDSVGNYSGAQQMGTWTVNVAPSTVSVTPATGSGTSQSFAFVYSDPNGFADIARTNMIIHNQVSSVNACFIEYTRSTNLITVSTNSGGGWVGSAVLGSAVTLQNSQCTVAAQASSAGGSGNTLTVTLAVTFAASFTGDKNIYLAALDSVGNFSGIQTRGAWTVNGPPSTISVTPSSGAGASQSFAFAYSDPNGFADITRTNMIIHTQVSSVNSCFVEYTRSTNSITLSANDGGGWVGSAVLGSAVTLQNSQCAISALASSSTGSGNNLTVTLAVSFLPGFTGTKNVYLAALDSRGSFSGAQQRGTWTPQ